tara:strand:+ start:1177 stop:1866 length:690 start_codon:yes stop_codon:yes gene_type:complete
MSNKLVDDALPVMEMPDIQHEKTEAEPRGAVNFDDNPTTIESVINDVKDASPSGPGSATAPRQRREEVEEIPEVLEVKPIIEDEEIFKEPSDQQPPKRKKKASAKQLEHLAKAREKALATRRKNAAEKKKNNAVKTLQKEAKITAGGGGEKEGAHPEASTQSFIMNLSPAQLQQLQEDAIDKYELKRKARKKIKKEAIEEQKKATHTNNVIHKAITQTDPDDMWSVCFQ